MFLWEEGLTGTESTQRPGLPEKLSTNPPLIRDCGIGPESMLCEKLIEFGKSSQRLSGILPVKRLFERSRTLRDLSEESESAGIEEFNLLPCKRSKFNLFKLPIWGGIGPERRLLLMSILTKLVALEIPTGSTPEILLLCMNNSDKFRALPIEPGIGPLKLLLPRSIIDTWGRPRSPMGIGPSKRLELTRNLSRDWQFP
ncbi:hypothetical protein TorRG33x02_296220 [Trema orientale]|uniref:Uncharacterized protein n=1 Tax=Trema orientale TaxID=63057 RepID=A0A2P5C645_TREOI|nr:hypothetical protein TorRG33x02_296220 [Trema orientale]